MTTADTVRIFAPAKINLFLHVGDKRADGYHALQSLVVFAEVGDELSFLLANDLSVTIDGPFAASLSNDSDNLVLKAARVLADRANVNAGARITLTKNLPVASGIGGGSADAAATLRGLADLWNLDIAVDDLCAIAETLGSDVPVCVASKPAWMEGRGEQLMPVGAMPQCPMVLINPGVAVPTADVFHRLRNRSGVAMHNPERMSDLLKFLNGTSNDLEAPAREVQPVIGDVLESLRALPGIVLARMSGSGATCFGILDDEADAGRAARTLSEAHPRWWVRATRIAQ